MTDISKEAVERHIERIGPAPGPREGYHASLNYDTIAMLRALSARVQELETQNKTPKADYVRGRVQGIRDAVEVIDNAEVQEAYDEGCRIHFDDLQDFFANRVDALSKPSKETPND